MATKSSSSFRIAVKPPQKWTPTVKFVCLPMGDIQGHSKESKAPTTQCHSHVWLLWEPIHPGIGPPYGAYTWPAYPSRDWAPLWTPVATKADKGQPAIASQRWANNQLMLSDFITDQYGFYACIKQFIYCKWHFPPDFGKQIMHVTVLTSMPIDTVV